MNKLNQKMLPHSHDHGDNTQFKILMEGYNVLPYEWEMLEMPSKGSKSCNIDKGILCLGPFFCLLFLFSFKS